MKKLVKVSLVIAAAMFMLSSCGNCYKKMQSKVDGIQAKCAPEVLSVKGNSVSADITVTFPPKYFDGEAVMKITPVLVYEGGEILGTAKFVQGEYVKDNYTVIPWKEGGSYKQTIVFPYDPKADVASLELRCEIKCSDKCKPKFAEYAPFAAMAVAQGISNIQSYATMGDNVYMTPLADNYSRVTSINQSADIMYLISSSQVRKPQLTKEQVKLFEDFVKKSTDDESISLNTVYSKGYASPDGPLNFNDKLSKARSESGQKAIKGQLKGVDVAYDAAAYGEDWDGFKALVEESNIEDKNLILQVLQMYSSPVEREREIKNMSSVFQVLAKDVLPKLRKTQLVATADVAGLSDAEILAAAKKNDKSLTVEEMLYAATLTNNLEEQADIYELAAKTYNDVRAYNNLGIVQAKMGDLSAAKESLIKASKIQADPAISNNIAAVAIAQGNLQEAKQYLSAVKSDAAKKNQGLIDLAEGEYAAAQQKLDGYNLAVAELAEGNIAKAKAAVNSINTAEAEYLKAVIAMKEADAKSAVSYLKSAIAKDASLKAKAQKDVNFAKLFGTKEFLAL